MLLQNKNLRTSKHSW